MPLYFFDVGTDAGMIRDRTGLQLDDDEHARAEVAHFIARLRKGLWRPGSTVFVTDSVGNLVGQEAFDK